MSEVNTNQQEETVTISKREYDQLIQDQNWLNALEGAGVDNWEGYDSAREILDGKWD